MGWTWRSDGGDRIGILETGAKSYWKRSLRIPAT